LFLGGALTPACLTTVPATPLPATTGKGCRAKGSGRWI